MRLLRRANETTPYDCSLDCDERRVSKKHHPDDRPGRREQNVSTLAYVVLAFRTRDIDFRCRGYLHRRRDHPPSRGSRREMVWSDTGARYYRRGPLRWKASGIYAHFAAILGSSADLKSQNHRELDQSLDRKVPRQHWE